MKKIRVKFNHFLCLLGIRKILPQEIVSAVEIKENDESFVELRAGNRLYLDTRFTKKLMVRKTVGIMLMDVVNRLPVEFSLIIVDAYRSLERQKKLWEEYYEKVKIVNPKATKEELIEKTRLFVAQPLSSSGGHQTGGAIDVTLGDVNGKEFNLGTKLNEFTSRTKMYSRDIDVEEKKRRKILFQAMVGAGFKNYPAEWWHFSYGDKLWAAYSRKNICFYGPKSL